MFESIPVVSGDTSSSVFACKPGVELLIVNVEDGFYLLHSHSQNQLADHHYLLYNFYYMFKYKGRTLPIGGVICPRVWKNNKNLAIYSQFTTFDKNATFIATQTRHGFALHLRSNKLTRNCANWQLIVRDILKSRQLHDGNSTCYAMATWRNLRRFTSR